MNSIEEKLWDYIDGTCSADEHAAIARLIETDATYREKYEELIAFNVDMAGLDLEEPSMGFTFKVMEAVKQETVAVPLKAGINKNVIRGLVGIFIALIVSLIIYAFLNINWSAGGNGAYELPKVSLPALSKPEGHFIMQAFVFVDAVLLLFFADLYLRRQRMAKQL
ncbi:anti-sigma factor [Mucilaginibacter ginkgonis]|uniref:Uncharacterized protein n=1 Tax=Mucilaginibacter ginkgonis TaxID=2682091 RepID=A0A6I4I2R2_9SPHI|nr:hypothetical protein [Mucilaginibacter ginkgonis]QQL49046.1 hypothetical protein GO620_012770 [Mucilaginibacter ginkgonis]